MGLLSVLAGIVVLSYPGLTLLGLATVLGIWLAIFGVMEITAAFRIRGLGRSASRTSRLRQRLTGKLSRHGGTVRRITPKLAALIAS
jgi:uncharacterized membrane protein HdeD (DUF308 family)